MSSLGFQLVYTLLNSQENIVCERFFFPTNGQPLRSIESGRRLDQFPIVFFSISFEHDYINLVKLLKIANICPLAEDRTSEVSSNDPLIVCGGVATFINPEPLAPFMDLFFLGEAESGLLELTQYLIGNFPDKSRKELLLEVAKNYAGSYVPFLYEPQYDEIGRLIGLECEEHRYPVKKVTLEKCDLANHSQLITPEAEFSDLFLTELGRGCSRGCRFCTAGFIYRPPRLWDADAVVAGLKERFEGTTRVGLLGMEMMDQDTLAQISQYLMDSGCSLSFSSLRADRIDTPLLDLLSESNLKNVAIAPDGSSERLRNVINKGLSEEDILQAAENLVEAGIYKLKLYLMIGLPTETDDDLKEALTLIDKIKERIKPIGQERGRLCEISVSANCFAPKPWTPFQFHPFGISEPLDHREMGSAAFAIKELKRKQKILKNGIAKISNVSLTHDKPENVLFQAILSRGDRKVASVLLKMVETGSPWKQAMNQCGLTAEQYAIYGYGKDDFLPWSIVDHGIKQSYLWEEYQRSFEGKITVPCDVSTCKRCGVCNG